MNKSIFWCFVFVQFSSLYGAGRSLFSRNHGKFCTVTTSNLNVCRDARVRGDLQVAGEILANNLVVTNGVILPSSFMASMLLLRAPPAF